MNIAALLGTGAGLTWLTSPSEDTSDTSGKDTIGEMVDRAINEKDPANYRGKRYTVQTTKGETPADEEEEQHSQYMNPKLEYKSLTTELVNRYFLVSKADVFHFLRLVIETHVRAIQLYVEKRSIDDQRVIFIFKGGNLLRIVASEFMVELPGHAADLINEFYMPHFHRSDADFSIYIDPTLREFQKIHAELTHLTYLLQVHIREHITTAPERYFQFFRLNCATRRAILERYQQSLNESRSIEDPTNERFYGGRFNGVLFEGTQIGERKVMGGARETDTFIVPGPRGKTVTFTPDETPQYIRIQYNTALDFGEGSERAAFHLVRTKLLVGTHFVAAGESAGTTVLFGGEIVDVSIPRKEDSSLADFFKAKERAMESYELRYRGDSLTFMGYSLEQLIDDLDLVLFTRSEHRPWNDKKYVRRLYRLFYLCFVQLFVVFRSNVERRKYLKSFCSRIASKALKDDIGDRVTTFNGKWKRYDVKFARFARQIARTSVPGNDPLFGEFRGFVEHLQRNCITTLTALKNIGQWCGRQLPLSERSIYEGRFSALVREED